MSKWGNKKHWTKERILEAIKVFHDVHNFWPETSHFHNRFFGLPHSTTVQRVFGTLAEARRQAGMPKGGHEGHGGSHRR